MILEVSYATTTSNEPAPGGESVSALTGILAAALTEMVAQLIIDKKSYEEAAGEMKAVISEAAALHAEPLDEITRDSTPLNAYMGAMTLSKDTDEQKEVRHNAMWEALKKAAEVPLYVAVTAVKIMPMAGIMVKKENINAVTDDMVAAIMTHTAVLGVLLGMRINPSSIKGEVYVTDTKTEIHEIEAAIVHDKTVVLATSPLK